MLRFINRLFFKGHLREYIPEELSGNDVGQYKATAVIEGKTVNLTTRETLISLEPLQLCILSDAILPDLLLVDYSFAGKVKCSIRLRLNFNFGKKKNCYAFFVEDVIFHTVSRLVLYSYFRQIRRGKQPMPYKKYMSIAAIYSIPRRVILVSVRSGAFETIFPMDLQLEDVPNKVLLLGLRTSNKATIHLRDKGCKIAFASINYKDKDAVYSFGNFHSNDFPAIESFPYRFLTTSNGVNRFPDFIRDYCELELMDVHNAGEQNILELKILTGKNSHAVRSSLYHRHFLTR